ncbi:DUF3800 domain-containing protein [Aquisphaera insulae]|uniref:DUF3800 domain-containing protein n=1 Tax=Aquisphaera insulae TaxID=2712864 RepID=UPI0013EDD671|nr:DUF3800 domain-containing protein [Aquisphaera insulae]
MDPNINIYCDESGHLLHDGIRAMVLGAVWCPADKSREISVRLRETKIKHGLAGDFELKWTKASPSKVAYFVDVVDYFFDDDDLHFRGLLIPDKSTLDHSAFDQSHDDWYYKMCFRMLEPIIEPSRSHAIYLDIKDTRSEIKRAKLERVLRSSRHDRSGIVIRRVQQIRSHESDLMQVADLLIGAVGHANRPDGTSEAKREIIRRIQRRSGKRLDQSTWLREPKFNLFRWSGGDRERR